MAINPEISFSPEIESKAFTHPELHEPVAERLLDGVARWTERRSLADYPTEELEAVKQECEVIEQEHLEPHVITLDSLRGLAGLHDELLGEKAPAKIHNILMRIEQAIHEYGEAVRQHVVADRLRAGRPEDAARLLDQANRSRTKKHEVLIEALQMFNTYTKKDVPPMLDKAEAVTWKEKSGASVFRDSALTKTKGVEREYIGGWALDMEIVSKARALQAAIHETLEKKSAATG